jgi:hypothetical protein
MPRRTSMRAGAVVVMVLVAASPAQGQQRLIPDPAQTLPVSLGERAVNDVQTDSAALGTQRGTEAARFEGTGPWVMRGFLGGLALGPIGTGLVYVVANNSDAAMTPQHRSLLLQEGGLQYANAYQRAYAEALHARRKRSALTGGVIGTAALAATLTAIWAVYN